MTQLDFWSYVTSKLAAICELEVSTEKTKGYRVERAVILHTEKVLQLLCDDTMVFPTINSYDNGIIVNWYADAYSLEIIIDADLTVQTFRKHPKSQDIVIQQFTESDTALVSDLRRHLTQLSNEVKQRNANWMQLITW